MAVIDVGWCAWLFDAVVEDPGDGAGLRVSGASPVEVTFSPGDDFIFCRYDSPPGEGDPWELVLGTGGGAGVTFPDGRPALPASGTCVPG